MSRNVDWCLFVGPGEGLADLKAFLVPEASSPDGGACAELVGVDDLDELARIDARTPDARRTGRVVLDGDALALEDVGLVRRFVRRATGFELVLCGRDPSRRAARTLLAEPRTRWLAWPPDLDDLHALMRAPMLDGAERSAGERDEADPNPARPAKRDPGMRARESASARAAADDPATAIGVETPFDELAQIEAILGTPPALERGASSAMRAPEARRAPAPSAAERSTTRREERAPFAPLAPAVEEPPEIEPDGLEPDSIEPAQREPAQREPAQREPAAREPYRREPEGPASDAPPAGSTRAAEPARPAPYFRDQVADLANVAQRIELGVAEVREAAQATEASIELLAAPLEGLTQDVARLLQFARTLGYLVAPPPAGSQLFDLGELLEVRVRELVTRGAGGPRCLYRKNGAAEVRSDRQLVSQALDALFVVAEKAAGPGQIVRVQVRAERGAILVTIEFPAGVLAGMDPARVLEPYALRRAMPEVGPNALSAAVQILRGQGGDAELARRGDTRFEWRVRMPLAGADDDGPADDPDPIERPPSAPRAEDPFA